MIKLLLADDEGIVLESLQRIVAKNFGDTCEVRTAKTGRAVIEVAEEFRPDIAMMDIQMPEMDGYEATRRIRALPDAKKAALPIVAMTANAFEDDRKNALHAGMNGHIAKPLDIQKLFQVLSELLK